MIKIKVSKKVKDEFKSWLRSVGVASVTTLLAIAADIRPDLSILLGSLVAPIFKAIDPTYKNYGVGAK